MEFKARQTPELEETFTITQKLPLTLGVVYTRRMSLQFCIHKKNTVINLRSLQKQSDSQMQPFPNNGSNCKASFWILSIF